MQITDFLKSLETSLEPPNSLSTELQSLWWIKKGNWEKAHDLAQDAGTRNGDWIHAYLHRVEGDLGNASYWYRCAEKPQPKLNLKDEWEEIVRELIGQK